jgi:glycosyltransferase involved in cell wall biosynthesis
MDHLQVKQKPLVSVIIPTHNRAQLLEEALLSVLAQERAGEEFDLEILVIDDASSDNTPEVVRKYPQVQPIRLETNHGEGGARNFGIRASQGKYIAFLDDDDLMLPDRFKLQVPAMEAHPEVGVVYSQNIIKSRWAESHRATSILAVDTTWPNARRAPSGDVFNIFLKEEFLSMDTLLVRREAFEKAGYFENYPTEAHYDMFLRLAFHVPFLFVEGNVAITWANPAGVFHARLASEDGYGRMLPKVVDKALAMLPDSPYSRTLRSEVHVALVPRLFCMVERIPDQDGIRKYVNVVFRACPWILIERATRNALSESAFMFCTAAISPIATTKIICQEIKAAMPRSGLKNFVRLRFLLGDIWMMVAVILAVRTDCARGQISYAVSRALLYNPARISADCLKVALRLVVGSRCYSYITKFKRTAVSTPSVNTVEQ